MQDVKIGKTKVPVIAIVGAAAVGLILFLTSKQNGSASGGELGTDQTAADLNAMEELRTRIEGDIADSETLRQDLRDLLDEVKFGTRPGKPDVGPIAPPPVIVSTVGSSYPTAARPLTEEQIAKPGVDYDPAGLGSLIADIFGPTTTASGKYILTDNWNPDGSAKPVGAAPVVTTPVVATPGATKTPAATSTPIKAPSTFTASGGSGSPANVILPPVRRV